ncbi:MAG: preprotein translocase subunit YajC [Puniceicoccales bacterium]|jgi:preprotein translocase subunit YajC|nr:preprotein translocase subunit YajC [Puniceicoccales bacterium]
MGAIERVVGVAAGRAGGTAQLWIFVLLFAAIWFLTVAPARRRQKQQRALLEQLRKGDGVLLSCGIFGKIVRTDGQRLTLEVARGVRIEVLRESVRQKVADGEPGEGESPADGSVPEEPAGEPPERPSRGKPKTKK